MKVLGIIVEYNPFHNGHIHHIKEAQKMINPDITIAIMSGNFVQRGEPAIVDKWTRAGIALEHGIDLIIELPFVYAVQSADYFAHGAIDILQALGITDLVFGSEQGVIEPFIEIAKAIHQQQDTYDQLVKQYMQQGLRYPDACNQALSTLLNKTITTPNDLLGLAYVKEVIFHNYPIQLHCISRTNDFHGTDIQKVSSATAIREALQSKKDISHSLPSLEKYSDLHYLKDFFPLLQYALLTTSAKELQQFHLVEEGLENSILKHIQTVTSMEELINCLTSKRYTRSRIQRMIIHILMHNKKTDIMKAEYIRILGMNTIGQLYLNRIKKETIYPLISKFSSFQHPALEIEFKATKLYACISKNPVKTIEQEYKNIPIRK